MTTKPMSDDDRDRIYITGETARRILANMHVWLDGNPGNDEEWLAKMDATAAIREDFEAILAENAV
jgi:hypothetical protein